LLPVVGYLGLCFVFYIFIGICTYLIKNYKNKTSYFLHIVRDLQINYSLPLKFTTENCILFLTLEPEHGGLVMIIGGRVGLGVMA
jgi:hypothetical protein